MKIEVTQITFLREGALVAGIPVDDQTKVVIAAAPTEVALEMAIAMSVGLTVTAEPPDGDVRDILEKP